MPDQPRIESIEDIRVWIADHGGRSSELWRQQEAAHAKMERRMQDTEHRLSTLEKRMMWVSGVAAGFGGLLGALLPSLQL